VAIVEAAGGLADDGGLEALSLVDLAERLGIRKPSLYNRLAGIGELRRELALVGLRELGRSLSRAAAGKAGAEGLFALAYAYRAFVKQRPGLYEATVRSYRLSDPDDSELGAAEEEAMEPVSAVLASCGIPSGGRPSTRPGASGAWPTVSPPSKRPGASVFRWTQTRASAGW
jgi:AcrR family transcriptional regulator